MSYIGNTSTTQAFTPAVDFFSGTGSATAFTLSRPVASVAQVQVTIDNVAQNPSSAYTISSNTITFTSAPLSGTNNIYVYYTSPITQVIAPGQGTVTATSMASSTGTGAGVFQTSPTITTPTISSLSSASATSLTLQSAGTTAITVDTSQNVLIATTNAITGITGVQLTASNTSENPAYINIFRDDTTIGSGQFLGYLQFCGRDATSSLGTGHAYVAAVAEADHGAGDNATAITFGTTPDNSSTITERMRITSAGVVQVGNNAGTGEVFAQNTVKAWGVIVGSSGALYNSFGISSSSRISTGVYSISFTRTLGSSRFGSAGSQYGSGFTFLNTESTTSVRVNTQNSSGTNIDSDCQFLIAGGSS